MPTLQDGITAVKAGRNTEARDIVSQHVVEVLMSLSDVAQIGTMPATHGWVSFAKASSARLGR
jgi:hypothetical protein